ncbi:MAG: long-chain fatty acid--CoA ligase [Steroidobacteraceae bacterium]
MNVFGLMQEHPLTIPSALLHAARNHPRREIVSRLGDGSIHRSDYATVERRARRLAQRLEALGMRRGDRIATLAWNTGRHLECFYGVSGMGAVLHTVNPRLFREQIAWIIRHAEDRALLFDPDQLPVVEAIAHEVPTVEHFVVLEERARLPQSGKLRLVAYEDWIDAGHDGYRWPVLDERLASSLCYTSGTTGHPKGVLYSHRSTLLHALCCLQGDALGLSANEPVLPIVPMFHANAWSIPYCAPICGAKLVLPGPRLDPASLFELMRAESVGFACGVPTVLGALLAYLQEKQLQLPALKRIVVGGAALPPAMQRAWAEQFGVTALHGWGMTEMSPIGTIGTPTPEVDALPPAERAAQLQKQGRAIFGVELQVRDAEGAVAPQDGVSFGPLWVRGHAITRQYFREEGAAVDADGWFPTGDVATLDPLGYMKITDRTKDVIKSGGEWISSIDIENAAMAHPQVAQAASVAAFHPKWGERPVLLIVPAAGATLGAQEIREFLAPRMASWWLPDDIVFVKELPLNATGKILKTKLREQYWHHLHPKEGA